MSWILFTKNSAVTIIPAATNGATSSTYFISNPMSAAITFVCPGTALMETLPYFCPRCSTNQTLPSSSDVTNCVKDSAVGIGTSTDLLLYGS